MNRYATLMLVCLGVLAGPAAAATDATAARAIALAAADALEHFYVFPSAAHHAADRIRTSAQAGDYDALSDEALATRLTQDLTVLHDLHVRVSYAPDVLAPASRTNEKADAQERAAEEHFEGEMGYGLTRLAHLPGNVGYVALRFFAGDSAGERRVIDGIADAIGSSDAVILDLRRNGGGSPESVDRLLSHFVAPKTHLNDFIGRGDDAVNVRDSYYTSAVPGAQIAAPLYVLTSSRTFSGGEECAYDLQALRRATLVGETTGGGANPGSSHRLGDHFEIFVPDARARNPITHTNWEGVGVKPDVAVPADRALATAYAMALSSVSVPASMPAYVRDEVTHVRGELGTLDDAQIFAL